MTERDRSDTLAEASLPLLSIIWGANFAIIKVALEELHPLTFNSLRFPLAAAVLWLLLRVLPGGGRHVRPERHDLVRIVALGFLGHVGYQLLFIVGVDLTTAGNASLLLASTPAWTLLLSVAAGHERPGRAIWLGVGATVLGTALVVLGNRGMRQGAGADGAALAGPTGSLEGDLLMLGASLSWALYTVGGRRLVRTYGALPVTAWTLWVGTPFVVLIGLPGVAGERPGTLSPVTWGGVVYAGVLAISVAYLIWYWGVERLGSSRTAVYSNLVPVVALAVAWAWLGERPTPLQWIGAAVVLGGITLTRMRPRPAPPAGPSGDAPGAAPPGTRTRSRPPS